MGKTKKRGLGKGLEALIPQSAAPEAGSGERVEEQVLLLGINQVFPNPDQPRREFDQDAIQELANSIKVHGIIQPLVVAKEEKGYKIIAGERRWRAARLLQLKEIPCILKIYRDDQVLEIALVENLQREDLNPMEEALAFHQLIQSHQITQEALAETIGKSRPYIANAMRLLQLDSRVQELIRGGKLTSGHGRVLLRINDQEQQFQMALRIIEKALSVRQVEALIVPKKSVVKATLKEKDYQMAEIEDILKKRLGTKVTISKGIKKGKIEIEYYNDDDLERLIELLGNS